MKNFEEACDAVFMRRADGDEPPADLLEQNQKYQDTILEIQRDEFRQ